VYLHDYSSAYSPAIPMVEVGIGLRRGLIQLTLPAIVDSGADATIIPMHYLHRIGAIPSDEQWLRGVTGKRVKVELYTLFIHIGNYKVYLPVVGGVVGNEVIIGRDVLNQFIVTLNGLASIVEISQ